MKVRELHDLIDRLFIFRRFLWDLSLNLDGELSYSEAERYVYRVKGISQKNRYIDKSKN
jgi:hypothetical protein